MKKFQNKLTNFDIDRFTDKGHKDEIYLLYINIKHNTQAESIYDLINSIQNEQTK
jgi:hypothetical protein